MRLHAKTLMLAALAAAAVHADPAPSSGHIFKADVLRELEMTQKKVISLAEATPEDKFAARPSGVRSIAEVYMHIAGANYFLTSFVGGKMPEGMKDYEKSVTEKAKVIEQVQKSYAHAKEVIEKLGDADLTKPVKMFGRDLHGHTALLILAEHWHEHLGQAIAYARASGVVPPWSKKE